jgi:phosphohistidine phosphatase
VAYRRSVFLYNVATFCREASMKKLHLLRHAKSAWDNPGLSDRERPLNKRGRRDAPRMGGALSRRLAPLSIAVSPARRAQLTLEGVCAGWPELGDLQHSTEEALYTFSARDLIDWIAAQSDRHPALFLIGHNPALTDLVNTLTGCHSIDNLPTAGYAELSLDIERWAHIGPGCAGLDCTLVPKQLPDD